jgi:hypothetical protein
MPSFAPHLLIHALLLFGVTRKVYGTGTLWHWNFMALELYGTGTLWQGIGKTPTRCGLLANPFIPQSYSQ